MRAILRTGRQLAVIGALLPPLAQSPGLTSGFGEYRGGGRFHAGLDYSTGGRTGLPVRAVADGWVERVRSSGVGYGRSVYLRLADGRTAVYGHLNGYAPALAAFVAARQDSSGLYEQDLSPPRGAFAFKRGEVIAFSGESGAGPPHLHFEVRRGDMNLHPLFQGITLADKTPPSIAAVALTPAAPGARVAGGLDAWRGAWGKTNELAGPTVVGPFTLTLDTFDRMGDRPNHLATYRLHVLVDGTPRFEAGLDSVSWDDMPIADRVFDLAATLAGETDRRVLQSTPGDRTDLVRRGQAAWSLAAGPHRLTFIAEDEAGNRTTRTLRLTAVPAGAAGTPPSTRSALLPASGKGGVRLVPRGALLLVGATDGASQAEVRTALRLGAALDSLAVPGGRLWTLRPSTLPSNAGKSPPPAGSPVVVLAGARAPVLSLGALVDAAPGTVRLSWPADGFYEDAALLAERVPVGGDGAAGLVPVSKAALAIAPADLALRRAVEVRWQGSGRGLGLFRRTEGGWSFLAPLDSSGVATATTRRLGTFALLADTTAPVIVPPPAYTARADTVAPPFVVRVSDAGAGLAGGDQVVRLDGRRVPAEYDPEADRLTWRPRAALAPGAHVLTIDAVDAVGNRASVRVPVEVR